MEPKNVAVANGRFNVEVLEDGSGEDLLYLHAANGLTWDPFLEDLAKRYHVIAPKLPGTGSSTGQEHLMDHHDVFYFLWDLLDELSVDQVNVVGHSMGGWFAAELAAMQPGRVRKLVLISPMGLWNDGYPVADPFAMLPDEIIDATFHDTEHPAAKAMQEKPEDEAEVVVWTVEQAKNLSTAARFIWPIPDKGLSKRIHRISSPTLLLWGKSDGMTPVRYAEDFNKAIANSEIAILEASGHIPQAEEPEATLAKITAFLG